MSAIKEFFENLFNKIDKLYRGLKPDSAEGKYIADMRKIAPTVIMDCTHSVQRPGAAGGKTGGNREFVPSMALAAKAFGATGYFFEVHPEPDKALSDGPNMLKLDELENVIKTLI